MEKYLKYKQRYLTLQKGGSIGEMSEAEKSNYDYIVEVLNIMTQRSIKYFNTANKFYISRWSINGKDIIIKPNNDIKFEQLPKTFFDERIGNYPAFEKSIFEKMTLESYGKLTGKLTMTQEVIQSFITRYGTFFDKTPEEFCEGLQQMPLRVNLFFSELGSSFEWCDKNEFPENYYVDINSIRYVRFVLAHRFSILRNICKDTGILIPDGFTEDETTDETTRNFRHQTLTNLYQNTLNIKTLTDLLKINTREFLRVLQSLDPDKSEKLRNILYWTHDAKELTF
jgi:hypothetical protein